jgi:hypothetical protein
MLLGLRRREEGAGAHQGRRVAAVGKGTEKPVGKGTEKGSRGKLRRGWGCLGRCELTRKGGDDHGALVAFKSKGGRVLVKKELGGGG